MENKIDTGFPHIDKPWMKYYEGLDLEKKNIDVNLVNYLKYLNPNKSRIALTYYGKEFSYGEFFHNVDLSSRVLSGVGVKKGDIVMCLLPNIPESAFVLLGATQIGAIADFIDPRPDSMDPIANGRKLLELVKYEKPKFIVALEECYLGMIKPVENELKELGIDVVVIISAKDSMNLKGKLDYLNDVAIYNELNNIKNKDEMVKKLKNYQAILQKIGQMNQISKAYNTAVKDSPLRIVKYKDLKESCKNVLFDNIDDGSLVHYIGHTSGTSGARPKPIALTNDNAISSIEQCMIANCAPQPLEKALHILPFFAPFGTYNNFLLNLRNNVNNISVPEFEIDEVGYLIKKYKPNAILTTPAWLLGMRECEYLQDFDLSFLTKIIYGGDSMTAVDEEKMNIWLKKHNCSVEIEKGHGMSETCGCGSYARGDYNNYDSIGIPLPFTTYTIVDPNIDDKLVPLKFNDDEEYLTGELAISSGHVTSGMLHDDVIVPHFELDGKSYIRTRDLGRMNRDGIFYIEGRKDRSFTRFDGFKIKPFEIEKEIEKNSNVNRAIIVEYYDERKRGNMPICHLVLDDDIPSEKSLEIIEDIVYNQIIGNKDMSSRQIPSKFKIRKDMPISKNSKIDFNELKSEGLMGDEISVDVVENNLATGQIEIYQNSKAKQKVRK